MNRVKKFVSMLGPFSPWLLLPGGLGLYGAVMQQWTTALINGLIVVFYLGHNYYQNRKLSA